MFPTIKIDLDDVGGFEPLAPGVYQMVFTGFELRASNSSPHPYVNVEFTIPDDAPANPGRKCWDIWSLHPKAIPFGIARHLKDFLPADSPTNMEFSSGEELIELLDAQLLGQAALITVGHEEYQGRTMERVKNVMPVKGPAKSTAAGTKEPKAVPSPKQTSLL